MSESQASSPTLLSTWVRRSPRDLVPIVGLLVSTAAFVIVSVQAIARGGGDELIVNAFAHLWTVAWLLVVTMAIRSVGIRETIVAFLSGFFLSTMIAFAVTRPLLQVVGENDATVAFVVPLVEESAKLVPLALVLWNYRLRRGQAPGVMDLAIVGFAAGAGMGMHEDVMYGRAVSSVDGGFGGVFTGPLGALFPSFFDAGSFVLVAHAGWGMLLGLGVGFAVSLRRRQPVLGLIALVVAAVVAVVDHAAVNTRGSGSEVISALTGNHQVAIALLVAGLIGAGVLDVITRRRHAPDLPFPSLRVYPYLARRAAGPWLAALSLQAYGHYRRGWAASAYSRAAGSTDDDDARLDAWLDVTFASVPARAD